MYTKQETAKQKQAFWTAFGRYMKPVLSADGEEIGWMNYKTGNKHVVFKMDVNSREARIAIALDHPGGDERRLYFERFLRMKEILFESLEEADWVWLADSTDEHGRAVGIIEKRLAGVNIFKNEDWPAIISFLKPRIIALDSFWSMVKYEFSGL